MNGDITKLKRDLDRRISQRKQLVFLNNLRAYAGQRESRKTFVGSTAKYSLGGVLAGGAAGTSVGLVAKLVSLPSKRLRKLPIGPVLTGTGAVFGGIAALAHRVKQGRRRYKPIRDDTLLNTLRYTRAELDNRRSPTHRYALTKMGSIKDLAAVSLAGAVSAVIPGPTQMPVAAALAPVGKKYQAAKKSTLYGYAGMALSLAGTISLRGRSGISRSIKHLKASKVLFKSKSYVSASKALANLSKPYVAASAVGSGVGSGIGYHRALSLEKRAWSPQSFSEDNKSRGFIYARDYQRKPRGVRAVSVAASPLMWILGGLGLLASRNDSQGVVPKITGALLLVIAAKRWTETTRKEKQVFVREYNQRVGTTFKVDNPKMRMLWNMTNEKLNKINLVN